MANDDWIRQLRDRLGDHTAPPPEGLWKGIERELARKRRQKRILALRVWTAAAVVLVAVLIGADYCLRRGGATETSPKAAATVATADERELNPAKEKAASAVAPCHITGAATPSRQCAAASLQTENGASASGGNTAVLQRSLKRVPKGTLLHSNEALFATRLRLNRDAFKAQSQTERGSVGKRQKNSGSPERFPAESRHAVLNGGKWSVGLQTANVFAAESGVSKSPSSLMLAADEAFTNSGFLYVAPQTQQGYEKTKHHLPVQIGLTASLALSGRLSLTSGVVYTKAVSDFSIVNGGYETTDRQTLRYIGVPLGLSCNVWQKGRFKAYATAGAQADFNIKATVETDGVKAGAAKDHVLWSVGAAAGAQYDIVPQVGLYAEPGVKYYFNNHSQVENVFKSRPCNFSLQVGVRVNLK